MANGLALYESSIKTLPLFRLIKFIRWRGGVNEPRFAGILRSWATLATRALFISNPLALTSLYVITCLAYLPILSFSDVIVFRSLR